MANQNNENFKSKRRMLRLFDAYKTTIDFNIICSITDIEGNIIYVNKRFCEVSKYSEKELVGQNHRIVNSGHHPQFFYKNLWETISSGKVWRGEVKSKAKDGSYFWLDSSILPIFEKGKIVQYFSLRIPIDEKKKLEQEREERILELEEMLSMISHRIRLPISHILGISELVSSSMMSNEELNKVPGFLKQSAESLDLFTRELTEFIQHKRLTAIE